MKRIAMALIVCMLLALVPAQASAAQFRALPEPIPAPTALAELPHPQGKTYSITMTSTGKGQAELYASKAAAGESVYFLADPEPGYEVSFDNCGYWPEPGEPKVEIYLKYIGANVYELKMPAGNVELNLEFVKLTTASHKVTLSASTGGIVTVDQNTAKKGEHLFIQVITGPGYSLESVQGKSKSGTHECYHLGKVEGAELYEVFMPNEDLEIQVTFQRNGPYAITHHVTGNGTVSLSHRSAYELETVTVTAHPARGHRVESVGCYHSQVTKKSENVWTFSMPKFREEVHITFVPITYALSVRTETPMGGTAHLDRESGTIGQTVTLTCLPEEGYRVARITGAKVTGSGTNTYTFRVDNADLSLSVLFLREENPFLDINETHFFYDSVLWAVEKGITNGTGADTFGPLGECNRAQVVTFLWRAAGSPAPESRENPFTDVPEGVWFTDAILWAVEQGITNGLTETTFGPGTVCNRAQVVTFLWRAAGSPAPGSPENPFTDVPEGGWFTDAVLWALENGITEGTSAAAFSPGSQCLRAQVVTFLHRADRLPKPEPNPETP